MKNFLPVVCLLCFHSAFAQQQVCPLNSNFSFGNLTHWEAYTGNNAGGNPAKLVLYYDSATAAPNGTLGNSGIYEYNLPGVEGIQILASSTTDPFGLFPTIPKINGYQYVRTILLGSTSITHSSGSTTAGGYVRGVSYRINVPAGPTTEPYTMTYAYAMVLENGAHNSNEQPLFTATLKYGDSVITCASPQYFLPTLNNATRGGGGATLDTATAEANGFFPSAKPSPNANPNGVGPGASQHLYDVWFKGWTEVTFDLAPFRGQQVTLTFETDNCVPGGHFAYSYIALRNTCAGLQISGDTVACIGSNLTYSVPALAGATYQWQVPPDWAIQSGGDGSTMVVKVGNDIGTVLAHEQNGCANLQATLPVTTSPPTIAGALSGGAEVCAGSNNTLLTLSGNRGSVLNWLASTNNGATYTPIADTTGQYAATNLDTTTTFLALIQNGQSCDIDTATATVVKVDPKTVGGALTPPNMQFCLQQDKDALLTLTGQTGTPTNWQSSPDGATWTGFAPTYTDSTYEVFGITTSTFYRVVVQSGVCPPQLSAPSAIKVIPTAFPQATAYPADTTICYGTNATLNASITSGTGYSWTYSQPLSNQGDGGIVELPYSIQATASPKSSTSYVLNVVNAGCPNPLLDTFQVRVLPPIVVDAGNDTSIVINQPLQLHASSNDTTSPNGDTFNWSPATGLDNPNIADPIATFTSLDSIRYFITATSVYGCTGVTSILVKVFGTPPDIFVPNAFTPGGATNSVFRPIPVGIKTLEFFRVFNRWGQLVYSTSQMGQGWDGRVNGQVAESGTYVWMVQGTAYTNKTVFRKGTMILVR